MARKRVIAGNWKMNKTVGEAVVLAQEISYGMEKDWAEDVDVVLIPPYMDIKPVKTVVDFDKLKIHVGAQNVYWEPKGAYTGEISVEMLKEVGCTHCIVGHSERRTLLGETNEDVNRKAKALLEGGLTPIICVGESLAIHDGGETVSFVTAQVKAAFAGIEEPAALKCIVAYEPIWAIGTGRTALPEQAQEVCAAIRQQLAAMYSDDTAQKIRVLYGGSMNPSNAEQLLAQPDVDGGLIGGAALKADSFVELVKLAL